MKIRHILLAAAVLTFASCAKEGMERDVAVPGEAIQMSSFRQQVFTRADVDEIDFPAGTKYTLLQQLQSSSLTSRFQLSFCDPQVRIWESGILLSFPDFVTGSLVVISMM